MELEFARFREDAAKGIATEIDGYETDPTSDSEEKERYCKRRSLGNSRQNNI